MTDRAPEAFLQWKGTDACLDLFCACGADLHFDGYFAYELTCAGCGRVWELPHTLPLKDVTADSGRSPIVLLSEGRTIPPEKVFTLAWPLATFAEHVKVGGIFVVREEADCVARVVNVRLVGREAVGNGTLTLTLEQTEMKPELEPAPMVMAAAAVKGPLQNRPSDVMFYGIFRRLIPGNRCYTTPSGLPVHVRPGCPHGKRR